MDFFAFDKAYLDRLRSGDGATEHHFVCYFDRFLNIRLRARALRSDQVEDLKQETLLRTIAAVRKNGGIRQPERFGAFVNSICNKVLLEFNRSSAKNTSLANDSIATSEKVPDLEDPMTTKPSVDRVRTILEAMPKRDRDLLRAMFLEEKDKERICKEMGVDRDYLRVLIHRFKFAFRHDSTLRSTKGETRHVGRPPGAILYSIAESICDRQTMEKIVCPLVADIQFEYREALCAGEEWRATWIRGRGWWSFFTAIGVNQIRRMFVRLFLRYRAAVQG